MRYATAVLLLLGPLLCCGGAGRALAEDPGAEDDPFADFEEADWDDPWAGEQQGLDWSGFIEGAAGARWNSVSNLDRLTLGEVRMRAETRHIAEHYSVDFKGELLWDQVVTDLDVRLRELAVSFTPASAVDVKIGRQVLTWGTGDLLFLNDLFPKDFISFFAGRDEDYLKSPADTARVSFYTDLVNVELAWTPEFAPDDYLYGERFVFWNPTLGDSVAPVTPRRASAPSDDELALRLFRNVGPTEYALYAYDGRWKQPLGSTVDGQPTFPRLRSWGASMRTPWLQGLFNAEAAFYDSRDDPRGDDPRIPNSELRLLLGYEQEIVRNLTAGAQLYAERLSDHARLIEHSPAPAEARDEWRSVATLRLTHRAWRDALTSSLFIFVSPSDEDFYLRPSISWRRDDHWSLTSGVNIFGGREEYTFFGQLEDNSNGWFRLRYNY